MFDIKAEDKGRCLGCSHHDKPVASFFDYQSGQVYFSLCLYCLEQGISAISRAAFKGLGQKKGVRSGQKRC